MNKHINNLVQEHIQKLNEIDTSTSVNKIIKSVDKLTQELYTSLLNTKERPSTHNQKSRHCC